MAKKKVVKKSGVNKSAAVRAELEKTPDASANEIAEAASKQIGEEVSAALVYQVRGSNGGGTTKKKKKKAGRKKIAKRTTTAPTTRGGGVNADLIKEAAELLTRAGNPKAAREALDVATEISKVLKK